MAWRAAVLALSVLAATPALAQVPQCPTAPQAQADHATAPRHIIPENLASAFPSRDLVADLITWIGENSGYDVADALENPPAISLCSPGTSIDYEGRVVLVDEKLRAAYDMEARRIFLVRPWSADDPMHVSSLLHELVHHVQWTRRTWDCMYEPEWQAYKMQDKWLKERGVEAGFDWFFIFAISRCQPNVHPGLEKAPD